MYLSYSPVFDQVIVLVNDRIFFVRDTCVLLINEMQFQWNMVWGYKSTGIFITNIDQRMEQFIKLDAPCHHSLVQNSAMHVWKRLMVNCMSVIKTANATINEWIYNSCYLNWFKHRSCMFSIWVRSRNCGCLVTWFCYQLIAKPGIRQTRFRDLTHMLRDHVSH